MADALRQVFDCDEQCPDAAAMFEPEVLALMRNALEASWSALAFAQFDDEHEIQATREELARRILERAAGGERRVPVLSGHALAGLEPRRAGGTPGAIGWRVSRYAS